MYIKNKNILCRQTFNFQYEFKNFILKETTAFIFKQKKKKINKKNKFKKKKKKTLLIFSYRKHYRFVRPLIFL